MSCYLIKYKEGHKVAVPVTTREEYMALRGCTGQKKNLRMARSGDKKAKRNLLQMNYSCLPNDDGTLKGASRVSNSVGMDVDFDPKSPDYDLLLKTAPSRILAMKDDIGLLMLERSVNKGYHLVFRRQQGMTNEENLKWASRLLGIEYDRGAKDITRVFFTTGATQDDLLYLDEELFSNNSPTYSPTYSPTPAPPQGEGGSYSLQSLGEVDGEASTNTSLEAKDSQAKDSQAKDTKANDTNANDTNANNQETNDPQTKSQTSPSPLGERAGSGAPGAPGALLSYLGIPYTKIIAKWWELYNDGREPVTSNRDSLTFELAVNLRNICGFDRNLLDKVIPCYDGFPQAQKMKCIDSALGEKRTQMPKRLKDVLEAVRKDVLNANANDDPDDDLNADFVKSLDDAFVQDELYYYNRLPEMPMGVKDSMEAVGPLMAMPIITAICPAIGALATGVQLDVHGSMKYINLFSYIAGDSASNKGKIDDVFEAWTQEIRDMDDAYLIKEEEYRKLKRKMKNAETQPDEPELPIRWMALNNTVPNLSDRLANTFGKHGISYDTEADTMSQRWGSEMNNFSVMIRKAYDNSRYDREAKSAEATSVHIAQLLWNITLCGTPDALFRIVKNYTDGMQNRIAIARTSDNTFAPLEDVPYVLTDVQKGRIRQVAHLLSLMKGKVVLDKVEGRGREWLEKIRLETMKNDDRVKARQRMRICVTAQRMTCCIMLCKVCEMLIDRYGVKGAAVQMESRPDLWKETLLDVQCTPLLDFYDVIADSLIDNALYFFRDRLENAYASRGYISTSTNERRKRGKNDSIFERLDAEFTFEQAQQYSIAVKGSSVTHNSVRQMLKNWRKQGLIRVGKNGRFLK